MLTQVTILYSHLLWADSLRALLNNNQLFNTSNVFNKNQIEVNISHLRGIIILEATYPNAELVEQLIFLKKRQLSVIVIGYHLDNEFLDMLIAKDLDAYVLKTCGKNNLFEAIINVNQGKKYFCAPITESLSLRLSKYNSRNDLTIREKEVLLGIVALKNSNQIAKKLNVSEATVRTHRKNIMRKFGAKNYFGLLRYACREGLIQSTDEQFCVGCCKTHCHSAQKG